MNRWLSIPWRWSWLICAPVSILFLYWSWVTLSYYSTFGVRYNSSPVEITLVKSGVEQATFLKRALFLALIPSKSNLPKKYRLDTVSLFIPQANLAELNENLPHSGYEYVRGSMINGNDVKKVKVRYRGDTVVHWDSPKKSFRVKTSKKSLYKGMRKFNVMAPKGKFTAINHLSYELARSLELITPKSEMVDLIVNGKSRGVHVLVEQLEELTIRESGRMPGDVYAGELFGKDKYAGVNSFVFEHPGLWDKIAVNNHFSDDSMRPLEKLIWLINQPPSAAVTRQLEEIVDLDAWAKFSAFETLTQSYHFDQAHNWRLYYDPWKTKFVPIVWDPTGWITSSSHVRPIVYDVSRTKMHKALYRSGAFISAKQNAIEAFFGNGSNHRFLNKVDELIDKLMPSIDADPYIKVSPKKQKANLAEYRKRIESNFDKVESQFSHDTGGLEYTELTSIGKKIGLKLSGRRPVKSMIFTYRDIIKAPVEVIVSYWVAGERIDVDVSGAVAINGNKISVQAPLVAKYITEYRTDIKIDVQRLVDAYYEISFASLAEENSLVEVRADRGDITAELASYRNEITPLEFDDAYYLIKPMPLAPFETWSGEKRLSGVRHIYRDVLIKPGTSVKLASDASVIFHGRLMAEGTKNAPIQFIALEAGQDPWGTVAIQGSGADGSVIRHCIFADGSGYKDEKGLFEYSSMFSIHNVQDLEINYSQFRDSKIVDDMVHAVYSSLRISNSVFSRSLMDALDVDISKAVLKDNLFVDSGNDAVDLMTSDVVMLGTLIRGSVDKGISVGEGSRLLAINSRFVGNTIAVQSKDGSVAALYNIDIEDNDRSLDAYKKNWRYNSGGDIYVYKTLFLNNKNMVTADKKSMIQIYDSSLDVAISDDRTKPRVRLHKTSKLAINEKASVKKLWRYPKETEQMQGFESSWWDLVRPEVRGSYRQF